MGKCPSEALTSKSSRSTSSPLTCERIYFSTLIWFTLPIGRGPSATISLTYCIALLESKAGDAAGLEDVEAGAGDESRAPASTVVAAAASLCFEHATDDSSNTIATTNASFMPFSLPPARGAASGAQTRQSRY